MIVAGLISLATVIVTFAVVMMVMLAMVALALVAVAMLLVVAGRVIGAVRRPRRAGAA